MVELPLSIFDKTKISLISIGAVFLILATLKLVYEKKFMGLKSTKKPDSNNHVQHGAEDEDYSERTRLLN